MYHITINNEREALGHPLPPSPPPTGPFFTSAASSFYPHLTITPSASFSHQYQFYSPTVETAVPSLPSSPLSTSTALSGFESPLHVDSSSRTTGQPLDPFTPPLLKNDPVLTQWILDDFNKMESTEEPNQKILAPTTTTTKRQSPSKKRRHPKLTVRCTNCHTANTPLWRRSGQGKPLCNACGLFLKLHGIVRPLALKTDVIKKRNRKTIEENHGRSLKQEE